MPTSLRPMRGTSGRARRTLGRRRFRILSLEALEDRRLLASGDLLHALADPGERPQIGSKFGSALAADGGLAVVGAPYTDLQGLTDVGIAYVIDTATSARVATLRDPTPVAGNLFGYSVAIAGNTVAVAAIGDDTGALQSGAVHIFEASSGNLIRTIANPTPAVSDAFGRRMALSGRTLVVGVAADEAAYVIDALNGALLRTLANPAYAPGDQFGSAVAIAGDTVVVGAIYDDLGATDAGSAYVFSASTGALLHTLANPTPAPSDGFASAVAVAGGKVLVGASGDATAGFGAGAAYLFDASTGALLRTLANPAPAVNDWFGWSVALSDTTAVVGSLNDATGTSMAGTADVFNISTGALLRTVAEPTPVAWSFFGSALALSGNALVIGSSGGSAYVFNSSTGGLLHELADLTPGANDNFGAAVAVSGRTLAVGAPGNETSAYLFDVSTGSLLRSLANPASGNGFGKSVAVSGHTVVVGAPLDDAGANDAGAAYVFDAATGALLRTLLNPAPELWDNFGYAVAVSGDTIVVGAPYDRASGYYYCGSAYVFEASTGRLVHTLHNPTPAEADHFGGAVAISGDTIVVAAGDDDSGAVDAGTVYVFRAATGSLVRTLDNPTPAGQDSFGAAVAVAGNKIVVGAPKDATLATGAGAAYVFDTATGSLLKTLTSPAPAAGDAFGVSVAISDDSVVVGAQMADAGASDAGAAYVFDATTGGLRSVLARPGPAAGDQFGAAVAAWGNVAAVGAPYEDGASVDRGGAYLFQASVAAATLDVDGNGTVEPLSDGILILRYLLDPTGPWNVGDALGAGATRTTRHDIASFLEARRIATLDADGNGVADALSDGILILRYMFDPVGAWNVADALGPGASLTTPAEISAALDRINPARSAAPADERVTRDAALESWNKAPRGASVAPRFAAASDDSQAVDAFYEEGGLDTFP